MARSVPAPGIVSNHYSFWRDLSNSAVNRATIKNAVVDGHSANESHAVGPTRKPCTLSGTIYFLCTSSIVNFIGCNVSYDFAVEDWKRFLLASYNRDM